MIASIFITSFLVGLSGALMPGPLLTVVVYSALRKGIRGGLLAVAGHAIIEAVLVILLFIGLKSLLVKPLAKGIIGIVGGLTLMWMGLGMLREARRGLRSDFDTESAETVHSLPRGILSSISNPYWSIWWATVGLAYMAVALERGAAGLIAFYVGHEMSDVVWYTGVSALVAGGRRRISQKVYIGLIVALGAFMLFLGAGFVVYGLKQVGLF
jgi:threonine/homoserine/homoserine lactone efflux protein